MVKPRAYNQENKFTKQETESAKWALYYLLERILLLAYPIIPQLNSTIADELKIDSFNYEWPRITIGKSDLSNVDRLMEFNSWVWKQKKDNKVSLKSPVEISNVPIEIKLYEKDLIACHKLVVK